MPHHTDKDMTYEEFSKLLKERYEKGESTDDYSYKSNMTEYLSGVSLGVIDMNFDDYIESKKDN